MLVEQMETAKIVLVLNVAAPSRKARLTFFA